MDYLNKISAEILSKLMRFKNGVVADGMGQRGILYERNYGVPLKEIKKTANEYFPNHALALTLFARRERELKLAAVFIDSPNCVDNNQIDNWSKSFFNTEITELCCKTLFGLSSYAQNKITEWITSDNIFFMQAAWNMLSVNKDSIFIKKIISKMPTQNYENVNVQFAAIQSVISISKNMPTLKMYILQTARQLSQNNNANNAFVGNEILAFLNY